MPDLLSQLPQLGQCLFTCCLPPLPTLFLSLSCPLSLLDLCLSFSLSLCHTHTHTHRHTLSLSLPLFLRRGNKHFFPSCCPAQLISSPPPHPRAMWRCRSLTKAHRSAWPSACPLVHFALSSVIPPPSQMDSVWMWPGSPAHQLCVAR